eukprot:552729-Amphidinium_carterae.1
MLIGLHDPMSARWPCKCWAVSTKSDCLRLRYACSLQRYGCSCGALRALLQGRTVFQSSLHSVVILLQGRHLLPHAIVLQAEGIGRSSDCRSHIDDIGALAHLVREG